MLKNAVKCIAELITVNADQNIDFNDIKTIMKDSGHAMLGLAEAGGDDRVEQVVDNALSCPLISDGDVITKAQNFLFFISYGTEKALKISELEALTEKFNELKTSDSDVIWGRAKDPNLGDKIRLSVIVTNYEHNNQKTEKVSTNINDIPQEPNRPDNDDDWTKIFQNNNKTEDQNGVQNDFFNMQNQNTFVTDQHATTESEIAQNNIFEPVMSGEPVFSGDARMQQYGPQRIGSAEDQYGNNDFFNDLVNTPAILRNKRQEDLDMQNNRAYDLDNDMSDFFKDIPD